MKEITDYIFSIVILIIFLPIIFIMSLLIYFHDGHSPFYIADRVGKNGKIFKIVKLRSMRKNADINGVDSTKENDSRITPIGKIIRKYKLDEFTQFWNVLKGDMSIVGPRPNVISETSIYSNIEKKILNVKPGITDISSIVFADEGNILKDMDDPNIAYNQLIRPRKSILCLFYINNQSFALDLKIIFLTFISLINKKLTNKLLIRTLRSLKASENIMTIARRAEKLEPMAPPGLDYIITSRD